MSQKLQMLRERLEAHQIAIYFGAIMTAAAAAVAIPHTTMLDAAINPGLAFMLFVTFLQVPLADLRSGLARRDFLAALVVSNFLIVPALVAILTVVFPTESMIRLGILFVLLCPCIDYVVTFSHLGKADARLLLASTPVLLIAQMMLLPLYLRIFLGSEAAEFIQIQPFLQAFIWLIAVPLLLAAFVQQFAKRSENGSKIVSFLGVTPVPATAIVLFIVVIATVPQLGAAREAAMSALPIYVAYAALAPLLGWATGKWFGLDALAGRAIAFSTGTRNSLVVLPLALSVPGAIPILPAVIVMQTIVELVSELVYIRGLSKLGVKSAVEK